MSDQYQTIKAATQGEYKEKGSKFLAYAWPVYSEAAIKAHLEDLKKEHPKARHHCFAFRIGLGKLLFRANDDGEPSGTAGKPILGQIDSFGLTNIVVFVVRYFGGTKLGVPGLIHAYKNATSDALGKARIVTKIIKAFYRLEFDYAVLHETMDYLKAQPVEIIAKDFEASCSMEIAVALDQQPLIEHLPEKISNLQITYLHSV